MADTPKTVDEVIDDLIGSDCDCTPHVIDQAGAELRQELVDAGIDVGDRATLELVLRVLHRIGKVGYYRAPDTLVDGARRQADGQPFAPVVAPPALALNGFVGDVVVTDAHLLAHAAKLRRG